MSKFSKKKIIKNYNPKLSVQLFCYGFVVNIIVK